ncbi:hypothetical protein FHW69_001058 [Luteibacter sp. Sphag1AF]|uniref:Slam-dependent surface lipoprotein n=1 Tax=Luteibacter sp. Sphag1AF TaxID=2587031 RepID=UPI0017CD3C06|nr:Slam-dependent surface lipoprotein [Luteibacter sp. Sphag1AF]MBB3226468.1 hypothetical protein [Luteibacter sp. Sphag1AF]
MKRLTMKAFGLVSLSAFAFAGATQAQVVGASSNTNITAGASVVNGGPHHAGLPGIGVPSTGIDQRVDFAGLTAYGVTDAKGVTTLNFASPTPPEGSPPDHSSLGFFHFAKVSGANVYYGEWSQTVSATDGTHATYFAGDTTGTTVPTTGTATYAVQGISDYANKGALAGTFNANFGAHTLTGSVTNGSYAVNIGTALISGAVFTGNGATASVGGANVATGGAVNGRFFGANAASLAGIASFANARQYNASFGGTKQ